MCRALARYTEAGIIVSHKHTDSYSAVPKIGIALVGPGLVGRLVLEQFSSAALRPHFRIVSISNSRYTVFDNDCGSDATESVALEALLASLPASSQTLSSGEATTSTRVAVGELAPAELVERLVLRAKQSGSHIVLIDCTASDALPKVYAQALRAGLSVATPNKVAPAGPEALYRPIREAQASPSAGLFYCEGACGAGLPVLSTLADLVRTGDEIVKIEAVLSGTLSYIFNQYSTVETPPAGETPLRFSEIVRSAHEHGHTEPHPAEDLSGRDVARKLAILARLSTSPTSSSSTQTRAIDLPKGSASIPTQSLIPYKIAEVRDPKTFVDKLAAHDEVFETMRKEAQKAGQVLRYVGVLDRENGKIECGLRQFAPDHPFASLSGSHLSFAIYTKRYSSSPLVIQGPGYPVEVTASAVIADTIRVAERYGHRFGL
ncbi:hypothetical protein JCM10908_001640 [Rhodotorula pacifica]|uniref:uncharacterized protein n=1 Tax=Rhodotorula pacifica TaxID=1495444 RepID=UPI00317F3C2A